MTATPAPVIKAEMDDWVALGGGNSGICGDPAHTYGFHLAANLVPADDYSRWRDPNGSDGPYVDWDYCCAGDFSHKNNSTLRAMHANVLNDLMDGKYPMICEFIGKPWADKPVYYWARWNGIDTLQKYTGSGHDHWSHISWYRSRVDERPHLWTGDDMALDKNQTSNAVWHTDGEPGIDNNGFPWRSDSPKHDPPGSNLWITGQTAISEAAGRANRAYESAERANGKLDQILSGGATVIVGPELLKEVMLDPTVVETYAKAIAEQILGLRFEIAE